MRKALLKDATNIYDIVGISGERSFAEICEVRDFTVSELAECPGPRAALLRAASVRGALDRGGAGGEGTRRGEAILAIDRRSRSRCAYLQFGLFFQVRISAGGRQNRAAGDKQCPRLHRCAKVAMVRGRIPRISILGPKYIEAEQLVRISV